MAREIEHEPPIPEVLCRYVEAEWDGPDPLADFGAAARAWLAANPGRELPFAADSVEVRQHVVRLRTEAPAGSRTASPQQQWRSGWRRNFERTDEAGPWDD